MSSRSHLFWGDELRHYLEQRLGALKDAVGRTPEDHAMQADPEAWAEALVERHVVITPELGEIWMDQPQETQVDVSYDHFRRAIMDPSTPTYVPGYRVVFHLPFTGDTEVFRRKPSTYTTVIPEGKVRDGELVKAIEYPADTPANLDSVATGWAEEVAKWLGFAAKQIAESESRLRQHATEVIRARRQRIEKHREQLAQTKTPIGPPGDQGKRSIVEAIVRKPSPVPQLTRTPAVGPRPALELEPALQAEVFGHILGVIRATGIAMEKSPKAYLAMDEEERRDVIVNHLNTHYRGQTSAEAFNRSGHTDILVRCEDKNLFIGECKIWHGAKEFSEAVDQLFTYTAWRDTKTALVIFVGEKGLTEIIEKGRQALAKHAEFEAWQEGETETEFRATMRWPGDDERLIDLAVGFFHLPS